MPNLTDLLAYRRQQGSDSQKEFCIKYLHPVFGKPDRAGNYIKVVGDNPNLCFTAHHDTVHKEDGKQRVVVINNVISLAQGDKSSCLGADCTTGIWLILEMIKAKVPGTYVIHSSEEVGCLGSEALVKRNPRWLRRTDAVISFDRRGYDSIVTHQMGYRTCSDAFAESLNRALEMKMEPDPTGSYTDSNEYANTISECTNVSVGYFNQHTKNETQDLSFAFDLRDALICADFSNLVVERDPSIQDYHWGDKWDQYFRPTREALVEDLGLEDYLDLIREDPETIAHILRDMYSSPYDLMDAMYDNAYGNRYRDIFNS